MTSYGYTLSSEEHGPMDLVQHAVKAEAAGFDFLSISDHYHPWLNAQGHSPFVWSVLGAVANATDRIPVGIGVTCPTVRIHPAVIAQAAATTSLLFDGRFFLGLGTGEALNEHVLGHRWPPPETRVAMLIEAIDVMRQLWSGETVDHRGDFYTVENARLFDPPSGSIPLILSAFGSDAATTMAELADGYWGTSPDGDLVQAFAAAGGTGPRYAQMTVCWAADREEALDTVHESWPNGGFPGQLPQDLPTWTHFEQLAGALSREQATDGAACGPDVDEFVEQVRAYRAAGYDHVYFHQIGADQDGFLRFWQDELWPALERS
jgi:coenzyme F420-dependent glucose-6-phosphate dehydrogenase